MFQKIEGWLTKKEKYFFIVLLLINLGFIFNAKFYPSLDGPAHLYNSHLLRQVINGSDFIGQYFVINSTPIPNWINHVVLSSLLSFFDPSDAEKGTNVCYILLLSLSFRFFVKQIKPENIMGSFLIFPFLFSFLFHVGFLNFCYSLGFMFLGLGYFLKHQNNINLRNGLVLTIIVSLTYFSNVLGFVYLVFLLFAFSFVNNFEGIRTIKKSMIVSLLKKYLVLFLICSISIGCLILFYISVKFSPSSFSYKINELLDWVVDIRSLIVYCYADDKPYTQKLFVLLAVTFVVSFFNFYRKEKWYKFSVSQVLFITLISTFVLLLKLPDGSSAGMMSDRLSLMFSFIFLSTLVSLPIPKKILIVLIFCSTFINLSLNINSHKSAIKYYSGDASKIFNVSKHIREKSVVLPINMTGDWLEGHFSNYVGFNKEVIMLENYEADVGWFPLNWNYEKLPKLMVGTKQTIANIYWPSNPYSRFEKKIDYVFLYGLTSKIDSPEYSELKNELENYYSLDESINDPYVKLFKLK